MTYTVTCPDPDCKTVFEIDEETGDEYYDSDEPIECPECDQAFAWDYDPDKPDGEEFTLKMPPVEFEESDEPDGGFTCEDDTEDEDDEG